MDITSAENQRYKGWQKLLRRKYRDSEGLFLIEGPLLIRDALGSGARITDIVLSSGAEGDVLGEILDGNPCDAKEQTFEVHSLSSELFSKLVQTESPRDVLAVVEKPVWDMADRDPNRDSWLILDRIQDPGNAGTIIRTAEATGFAGLIVLSGTVDVFSPKVVRSAAGAILRVPMIFADGPKDLERIKNELDLKIYAADGDSQNDFWDQDFATEDKIGLVIGNEGAGIDPQFKPLIDRWISIPMEGKIESLNAGIAAAVIMYEIVRQNKLR